MEVLQTSALPLGDGAGRKRHLDYRGFPAASMRRNSTGENRRSSHRHPRTAHPGKSTRNRHPNSRNGAGRRSASVVKAARRGAGAPAIDTKRQERSWRRSASGVEAARRGAGAPAIDTKRAERSWRRSASVVEAARRGAGDPADQLMERETGFEPATSTLARSHSTTELFPLTKRVPGLAEPLNRCPGRTYRTTGSRASQGLPVAATRTATVAETPVSAAQYAQ
jgi:hypothetical protein